MRSVHRVLLKQMVFSRRPKLAMLRSGSRRSLPSAFQTVGPTTANNRSRPSFARRTVHQNSVSTQAAIHWALCDATLTFQQRFVASLVLDPLPVDSRVQVR